MLENMGDCVEYGRLCRIWATVRHVREYGRLCDMLENMGDCVTC